MVSARQHFDKELEELHSQLIEMGKLVDESIDRTITALKEQDVELAKDIFAGDDVVDDMEKAIERRCLNLIARQQPIAKDLRKISAALKMITDLERIADHSADIAELTIRMANDKYIKPLIDLPKMAEVAKNMVNQAIEAYVNQDIELAKSVCESDDEVDALFLRIVYDLTHIMKEKPETVEQAVDLMFVAKYLERMADHATNVAEWVIFIDTGEHKDFNKDNEIRNPFLSTE